MALILEKLEGEMQKNSVIALQEIGQEWAADLHTFFSERGYYFVCRHYGSKFNDYMGVGIAVPLEIYEIEQMDNKRVADTWWMPRLPKKHWFMAALATFIGFFTGLFLKLCISLKLKKAPYELWWSASCRWNILASVLLKHRDTEERFWVSTYHMPCAFNNPDMMTIHSAMALQYLQKISGHGTYEEGKEREKLPYVLLGDFNFKPEDGMYLNYLNGTLDKAHKAYPMIPARFKWTPDVAPVRSAYLEANGEEPEYTNNARVKEMAHFKETLDYVFLSPTWGVKAVHDLGLPPKDDMNEPFPSEFEPSDHVLLAADLTLN
jgi:hypothetical protein